MKTYSGKKRLSAGRSSLPAARDGNNNNNNDNDDNGDDNTGAKASSELGDTSPPRPRYEQVRTEVDASPAVDASPDDTNTPDTDILQPSQTSTNKHRERVSRNRSLLDSVRRNKPKSRKARRSVEDDAVAAAAAEEEELVPTPPSTGQVPGADQVSTCLNDGTETDGAVGSAVHQTQGIDDQEHESDHEEPVQAANTKSKSASKKAAAKRKRRDSSEKAASAPAKKRQKSSDPAVASATLDTQARDGSAAARVDVHSLPSQGPFNAIEVGLVEEVFEQTRTALNLTRPEMIDKIQTSSKEIAAMLGTITNDVLPNRNRKAVQRFCRRHFNDAQRGPWTQDQDDLVIAAFAENPNKWKFIGQRVGRMPEDCRDRWRNFLSMAHTRHTDVWTYDEELTLCKAIHDSISAAKAEIQGEVKPEDEDQLISWISVVKKMGGLRNRLQCTNKWKKLRSRANNPKSVESLEGEPHGREAKRREKDRLREVFKELQVGDILAMLKEIQYSGFLGRIDHAPTFWAIVTKMHPSSPYTTAERKYAYRSMRPIIEDSGDFQTNVSAIIHQVELDYPDKTNVRARLDDPTRRASIHAQRFSKQYTSAERIEGSDDDDEEKNRNDDAADYKVQHVPSLADTGLIDATQDEEDETATQVDAEDDEQAAVGAGADDEDEVAASEPENTAEKPGSSSSSSTSDSDGSESSDSETEDPKAKANAEKVKGRKAPEPESEDDEDEDENEDEDKAKQNGSKSRNAVPNSPQISESENDDDDE